MQFITDACFYSDAAAIHVIDMYLSDSLNYYITLAADTVD